MSNIEKARRLLALCSERSRALVVINADPDAIASAMAVKRMLWRRVHDVTIAHFNKISRPDNLAMIEYTESGLVGLESIDRQDYDLFIVVDSQPDHSPCFDGFTFDVIIDHHPLSFDQAPFADIRPGYGACATIMTEYLRARKIKPSAKLAAALMLGIKTDTADFTRQASLKDIRAFQYLYRFADKNIITKVERAALEQDDLDFLARAIRGRKIVSNRVFYHAGNIAKPDELVVAADFFLTLARINWSVISGVHDGNLVVILRNDGLRKGAGKTARQAFGDYGSAGGHKTMARAEMALSGLKKTVGRISQKKLAQWIIDSIEQSAGKKIA